MWVWIACKINLHTKEYQAIQRYPSMLRTLLCTTIYLILFEVLKSMTTFASAIFVQTTDN